MPNECEWCGDKRPSRKRGLKYDDDVELCDPCAEGFLEREAELDKAKEELCPKVIYIQWLNDEANEPSHPEEASHCVDKIGKHDVGYIRLDEAIRILEECRKFEHDTEGLYPEGEDAVVHCINQIKATEKAAT